MSLTWQEAETIIDQHPQYEERGWPVQYVRGYAARNRRQLAVDRDTKQPNRDAGIWVHERPDESPSLLITHYPAGKSRNANLKSAERVPRLGPVHEAWKVTGFEARTLSAFLDWYAETESFVNDSGSAERRLREVADRIEAEKAFEPLCGEDSRRRVWREIAQRQGQPRFRESLIRAYGGRCAVTGCDVINVLEAAHIVPYAGEGSNHVSNGLLLRADIHTLFDLDLLAISPQTRQVLIKASVRRGEYAVLHERVLASPTKPEAAPSPVALAKRFAASNWEW